MPTRDELNYVAGFFDVEGSVTFGFYKAQKNGKRYGRLTARISQKNRRILEWIRDVVGYGQVHARGTQYDCYDYHVRTASAKTFLLMIRPYLRVKGDVVDRKLAFYDLHVKPHAKPISPCDASGEAGPLSTG